MATDIQNSERLLDLSNQLNDSITERRKLVKSLSAEEQQYFATVKQQQKLSQDIAANAEKYLGYQIKSKDLSKQIKATEDNRAKSENSFRKIQSSITKNYQDAVKANSQLIQHIEKENKLNLRANNLVDSNRTMFQDLLRRRERGENIGLRELAVARRRLRDAQEEVKTSDKVLKNLETEQQKQEGIAKTSSEIIKNGEESLKSQREELAFLEKNLEVRKRIEKSTGLLGGISKALSKIPGIGQYLNADEAIDEMEKLAAKIEEGGGKATSFGNRLQIGLKGASVLAKGFAENLKSPEAIFTFILTRALAFNKVSVDIGKNLGASADESDKIAKNLANVANSSSNLNVTFKNAAEAMNQLNEATGGVATYSADALETQIMLTKQFGLTGEEAAGLYKFSTLAGKASSEVNTEMVAAFANTRNAVRGSADFKKTMAEAAKVSGQLAANFRNNPAAITAAVVQMQALGTTLEQTKKQGESLLDFESSIESELKAELLTGKQLNLERARAAALSGDQVTLAEELNKNVGSLEDFQKMNVLAQKSLAEAMGMTTDELATQLNQQKIAQEQGKSLAQVQAEDLEKAQKRQSIQDKFNAAIEKLQDFFGNLVGGPVGQLLEVLMKITDIVSSVLSPIFTGLGFAIDYMVEGLKVVGAVLGGIAVVVAALNIKMFASAALAIAKGAWESLGGIPFIGPILAGGAILAGLGALKKYTMDDGVIGPGGEPVLSGPAGSIQLNKNDSLIAGTNLFGSNEEGGGGISGGSMSIDLTPMINAITEVRDAVNKLYSKEGIVNIDGKKVGTLLTQGSYKTA